MNASNILNTARWTAAIAGLCLGAGVSAAPVPVWEPTDGDINVLSVDATAAGYEFAIFDDDDIGNENSGAAYLEISPNFDTIYVSPSGSDWMLSNGNGNLTLSGPDPYFVFGARMGGDWYLNDGLTENFPDKIYDVSFSQVFQTSFTAIDVKPPAVVPLPAPVALLGSGLLGLVAVGRRRRAVA